MKNPEAKKEKSCDFDFWVCFVWAKSEGKSIGVCVFRGFFLFIVIEKNG